MSIKIQPPNISTTSMPGSMGTGLSPVASSSSPQIAASHEPIGPSSVAPHTARPDDILVPADQQVAFNRWVSSGLAHAIDSPSVTSEQMVLTGALLHANPNTDFDRIGRFLAAKREGASNPDKMPTAQYVQDLAHFTSGLQEVSDPATLLSTLDSRLNKLIDNLEKAYVRFGAIASTHLAEADVPGHYVAAHRREFAIFADNLLRQISQQVDDTLKKLHSNVQMAGPQQVRSQQSFNEFSDFADSFKKTPAYKRALNASNHFNLTDRLAQYNQDATSVSNRAYTFLGAGIPQGISSSLHFGYARGAAEDLTQRHNTSGFQRALVVGSVLGTAHEAVTNMARPFAQTLADAVFLPAPRKVSPAQVIPDPLHFVANTHLDVRRLDQREHEDAKSLAQSQRETLINAQADHSFGTIKGDITGYASFGAAQMIRRGLDEVPGLDTGTLHARALASFGGGTLMAGLHALNKLDKSVEFNGRRIPTHLPGVVSGTLTQRARAVVTSVVNNSNPTDPKVRKAYFSKIAGGITGVALSGTFAEKKPASIDANGQDHTDKLTSEQERIIHGFTVFGESLRAFAGPSALLGPFFANNQAGPESAEFGGSRLTAAAQNIERPGRPGLPHGTMPGGFPRRLENGFNQLRGVAQVGPQTVVTLAEAVTAFAGETLVSAADATRDFFRPDREGEQSTLGQEDSGIPLTDLERGRP